MQADRDDGTNLVPFPRFKNGGGGGDGGDMYTRERIARLEATDELRERNMRGVESELKNISQKMDNMETRLVDKLGALDTRFRDKADENQKWLVALLVSAILVPLFMALVTK